MQYEFDPAKDRFNMTKHGLSFLDVEGFEWDTALVCEDARVDYAEQRFVATGYIGLRLCVLVFCHRDDAVRVISLRKANSREVKDYAQT